MWNVVSRIALCAFFAGLTGVNPVQGQSLSETLSFAQTQSQAANYEVALEAFRRVVFFDREKKEHAPQAYEGMADCYLALGKIREAANHYDLAYYNHSSDSGQTAMALKKTKCLLMAREFKLAQVELLQLPKELTPKTDRIRDLYFGIAYFGQAEFDSSERHFLDVVPKNDSTTRQQLMEEFDQLEKIRLNPRTAKVLSLILPGLGQFYAGDVKNGLNSLLLCSGWVALGVVIFNNYTLTDGILTTVPWYQRYYLGGAEKAQDIAEKKLANKRNVIYRNLLDLSGPKAP